MSQNAGRLDRGGNDVQKAGPGEMLMDQKQRYTAAPLASAGNQNIPAEAILAGIIVRAGPVGAYADNWPTADALLAACPALDTGDSFEFLFDNTGVAQANTTAIIAGSGIVLVNGNITASLMKRFMVTVLGAGRTTIQQALTTNASATLNLQAPGITPSQAAKIAQSIQVGMSATGTGLQANSVVIGVNSVNGTVTLNQTANATGQAGITFTPRVEIRGLYQAAA